MSELKFDLEWHEVKGSRGIELAATWARLAIRIGEITVTEAYDRRAQSVRQSVLVPLYPLAEWLASHWWGLLYEAETPDATATISATTFVLAVKVSRFRTS